LACLLVSPPWLLLLDEPFSNLDMIHKKILKSVVHDIGDKLQITCILVSHDPADTLSWADEILVMKQGQIIQQGAPGRIYNQPLNEYTAALFGKYNLINADTAKAFHELTGVMMNGKNLFIRPEHFKIGDEAGNTVKGTVQKVIFFGSYCEIKVLLAGNTVIIYSRNCHIKKGDKVDVSLSRADRWYL
jgi:ABC-type Fe3+/spermidine/putrescine transport system ATPase subunit